MSAPELITISVDGREVQVPKGTGLVEAAATAGIEIPVFCYEPRVGPAVGACRMCLVEIEGMPKLQTGCTTPAQDGMVVHTARSSEMAAEGQNATIEFLLLNHPLDCPVCDKGGECPLQDLSFRYGPGKTRMTFRKRTYEKPIPLSPTIALDRERCILCYRCTRFSQEVAGDEELAAVNRGARTMIATFEDEPYRGPFSGNIVELCPVGALTSTQYRFLARPWETESSASVCGLCSVGCNIRAQSREGKVKRVLSRNHPELDLGWLCDKGRFSFGHLEAPDRTVSPLARDTRGGALETVSWEGALERIERLARAADGRTVLALSGTETIELAYALATIVRRGTSSAGVVLPEPVSDALDAFRLPLSAIAEAQLIVLFEEEPVVERAPIVDLWLRLARRKGARIQTIGPTGDLQRAPGDAAADCLELAGPTSELGRELRETERAILIWSGGGCAGGARLAALAQALGLDAKPGSGAFYLPATPNGRGVAAAWNAAGGEDVEDGGEPEQIDLLIVSGDDAAGDPAIKALAGRAGATVAITLFQSPASDYADLVLPATGYLERDGTMLNLEGRPQRLHAAVVAPVRTELDWLADLGSRLGVELPDSSAAIRARFAGKDLGGIELESSDERSPLPARTAPRTFAVPDPEPATPARGGPLALIRLRTLFSGPLVERMSELAFQRPAPEVEISSEDADRRGIRSGDEVVVRSNGTAVTLRARVNERLVPSYVRIADDHAGELARGVEVTKA